MKRRFFIRESVVLGLEDLVDGIILPGDEVAATLQRIRKGRAESRRWRSRRHARFARHR